MRQAVLRDTQTVCLWLGANVMLEYPLQEERARSTPCVCTTRRAADTHRRTAQAEELLTRNHANALKNLEGVKAEVLALRDSITTTEARARLRQPAPPLHA